LAPYFSAVVAWYETIGIGVTVVTMVVLMGTGLVHQPDAVAAGWEKGNRI